MNLKVIGINYKKTPIAIREKFNFTVEEQKYALAKIRALEGVSGCAILSTCNRTEVYIHVEYHDFKMAIIERLLCRLRDLPENSIATFTYTFSRLDVVKHLFHVTCGLDSMVLGEDQILGQVKRAFELSLSQHCGSSILNELLKQAVTAAKRVKTLTALSTTPVSIATHAVLAIENQLGQDLSRRSAIVIGAGEMGELVAVNLKAKGLEKIFVTTRSLHNKCNATDTHKLKGVGYVDYTKRYNYLDLCDIVISATSSPHYTITKQALENNININQHKVLIDLAVPRDIEPSIASMEMMRCFNIDDLNRQVNHSVNTRMSEAKRATSLIQEQVIAFESWYYFRQVLPVVDEVKKYTERLIKEKSYRMVKELGIQNEDQKNNIEYLVKSTVNDLVNKIVYDAKAISNKEDMQVYFKCLGKLVKEGQHG